MKTVSLVRGFPRMCWAAVSVFAAISASASAGEPGKVAFAADFSKPLAGWEFVNHRNILQMGVVDADGSRCYSIVNPKSDKRDRDTLFKVLGGFFEVTPGNEFAVIVEARGDVSMLGSTFKGPPATALLWYDAAKRPVLAQDPHGVMQPTGWEFGFRSLSPTWVKTVRRSTVPDGAKFARVQVGGDGPDIPLGGGRLQIRRLEVREREGADAPWDFGDLEPPVFRRTSPSPDPNPNASVRFTVTDRSGLDPARFRCVLDGKDVTAKLVREGADAFVYRPTVPWAKDSVHLFAVEAADTCGNASKETLAFFCGEPRTKDLVTVRDDGMLLTDGRPFFPIGPFSVRPGPPNGYSCSNAVAKLKKAGFNTVHTYSMHYTLHDANERPKYFELLDACESQGMRFIGMTPIDYKDPSHAERVREALLASRRYSCILGWGVGDDTATARPAADVRDDANLIKAIDNAHITWQADITSMPGRQTAYAGATDAFIVEVYPFRDAVAEPHGLAQLARDLRFAYADRKEAGNPTWSIWGLPQAFSGYGLWKRFPTREEIRAEAYLSIVSRARGVMFYTYFSFSKGSNGFAMNDDQFERVASVSRELALIQDDLASRDAKVQPRVVVLDGPAEDAFRHPSVTCLLKDGADGRGKLLIAANARPDRVKAWIGIRDRVRTLFEKGREVAAANGLVDDFGPGEVHVYRLGDAALDIGRVDRNFATAEMKEEANTRWVAAKDIPMEGNPFWADGAAEQFMRLPPDAETNVTHGVWSVAHYPAGMCFRFTTDSNFIHLKWRRRTNPLYEGYPIDIYRWDAKLGEWRFVNCRIMLKPGTDKEDRIAWTPNEPCLITLPNCQVLEEFRLGIAKGARIGPAPARRNGIAKPVVFYGTSITQGAAAARPSMGFVNIIGRRLDVPVVNLGFSGNGDMQLAMVDYLARIDASCYVIDVIHNCGAARPGDRGETFLRRLRARRPEVPIVLCEGSDPFKSFIGRHRDLRALYDKFVAEGWTKLSYVREGDLFTADADGIQDHSHPNEWGMMHLAFGIGDAVADALGIARMRKYPVGPHTPYCAP